MTRQAACALGLLIWSWVSQSSAIRMMTPQRGGEVMASTTTYHNETNLGTPRFECDMTHNMCARDIKLFPHIKAASEDPIAHARRVAVCQELLHSPERSRFAFRHIPKNAGKAVERFLGIRFQGHTSMRRQRTKRFVVVLRHPIERFVSWYNFLKNGLYQAQYKQRQAHFCKEGTGRAHGNVCIPKLSLAEFILKDGSIYEASYLGVGSPRIGRNEPIGTDKNFIYEWLKPRSQADLAEVKEFLLSHALVVGDTARLSDFFKMTGNLTGMTPAQTRAKTEELGRNHVNPTHHQTVMELFDEDVYAKLAERHALDIELYYWGVHQGLAFRRCFGEEVVGGSLAKAREAESLGSEGLDSWWDDLEYGPPDEP